MKIEIIKTTRYEKDDYGPAGQNLYIVMVDGQPHEVFSRRKDAQANAKSLKANG